LARAETLYTPQVLALATGLAAWPWDDGLPLQGEARSKSCGSVVRLGLGLDGEGRVARVAIRAQACAIGQAAAAIFAAGAPGRAGEDIAGAHNALATWLQAGGELPDWPGLGAIAAARDYPARHGAILLAWQAATDLLFTGENQG
jgi:NifU-like protein involved in Fe-S cluster formation